MYKRYCFVLVVDEEDKVLMGRRNDSNKYTNPGGGASKNECPFHCAAREFKEETGADIKSLKIGHVFFHNSNLIYLFEGEVEKGCEFDSSKDPDLEVGKWEYVDPFEILDDLNFPLEENEIIKYWANKG